MATAPSKKTLADLAAVYDRKMIVVKKIKDALAVLKATGDDFAYENDFCAFVRPRISHADLAKHRPDFAEFWTELPALSFKGGSSARRAWFPTKALTKKFKETCGG